MTAMGDSRPELAESLTAHRDPIYRYIRRIVGDASEAEDLTQDTLLRAHEKLGTLKDETRLTAWLYRIATHVCYDRFRSAAHRHRPGALDAGTADEKSPRKPEASEQPRLDLAMEQDEMSACVRKYLVGLPDSFRAVMLLHDVEGLTNPEVARMLGISLATVYREWRVARLWLRYALSRDQGR